MKPSSSNSSILDPPTSIGAKEGDEGTTQANVKTGQPSGNAINGEGPKRQDCSQQISQILRILGKGKVFDEFFQHFYSIIKTKLCNLLSKFCKLVAFFSVFSKSSLVKPSFPSPIKS